MRKRPNLSLKRRNCKTNSPRRKNHMGHNITQPRLMLSKGSAPSPVRRHTMKTLRAGGAARRSLLEFTRGFKRSFIGAPAMQGSVDLAGLVNGGTEDQWHTTAG